MPGANQGLIIRDEQKRALEEARGCSNVPCPQAVKVVINLSQPVACPGQPLSITAAGTPEGGTYAWTASGAELVDDSGSPVNSGDTVLLRAFQADDSTGSIPEKTATVGVTYTHPNGTARDSKPVKIHKIEFEVTNTRVTPGEMQALEDSEGVSLENRDPNVATIATNPSVKIKLDPSCPRKTECAANHRAGWIQDVTAFNKSIRFRHRVLTLSLSVGPPVRDALKDVEFPFYDEPIPFTGDRDTQTVPHSDSPGLPAAWHDSKADEPADNPLEKVVFEQGFTAWLAVQNVEWSRKDMRGSLAFQRHFDWSINHTVNIDAGRHWWEGKSTPRFSNPTIGDVGTGKGPGSPSLTKLNADQATTKSSAPFPPPGHDRSVPQRRKKP